MYGIQSIVHIVSMKNMDEECAKAKKQNKGSEAESLLLVRTNVYSGMGGSGGNGLETICP